MIPTAYRRHARGLHDRQAFEGVRPPPLGSVRLQALVQFHQRRRGGVAPDGDEAEHVPDRVEVVNGGRSGLIGWAASPDLEPNPQGRDEEGGQVPPASPPDLSVGLA